MLQNASVAAFTVFELLRENQQGGKGGLKLPLLPTHIRVKEPRQMRTFGYDEKTGITD